MHIGQSAHTIIDHQSGTITAIADQPDGIPLYRLRVEVAGGYTEGWYQGRYLAETEG